MLVNGCPHLISCLHKMEYDVIYSYVLGYFWGLETAKRALQEVAVFLMLAPVPVG